MAKKLKLGVFGFGVVGQGLHYVLHETKGVQAEIKKFCIKDRNKSRSLDASFFTFDKEELLNDDEIDVIVELINNAEEAYEIVKAALKKGKGVVSANKKMIAEHFEELYHLQKEYNAPFLYEGSVCASIPIIRNLEEYYDNDMLTSVEGICNGTTNYILTKTTEENLTYADALKGAQESGFAETDPTLDVKAFDPKFKLSILITHTFGVFVKPENLFNFGIQNLSTADTDFARAKQGNIKLIVHTSRTNGVISGFVTPRLIPKENMFHNVRNEFNAVQLEAAFSDKQFFYGKGAGSNPTASAVLSDISALVYDYQYGYKKLQQAKKVEFSNAIYFKAYVRYKNEAQLAKLQFSTIEERYTSNTTQYVVGEVSLLSLLENNVNDWPDFFLIAL